MITSITNRKSGIAIGKTPSRNAGRHAAKGRAGKSGNAVVKAAFLAALMMIVLIMVAGCGSTSGKVFSYAEAADPTSIDPALVDESVGINIARYLFDGLVGYDSLTGEVKPAVAEKWEVTDNATVFTFHLRKGVKFTNGREVKASDFVYAWTRAIDPATKSKTAMNILEPVKGAAALAMGETKNLAGVEAVDDYTLKVTLEFPLAEFVTFLGHPVAAPVPREEVEKDGSNFSEAPIGNGPFMWKERRPNEQITLDRNAEYYGEKAKVDQVTVKIIPNPATAVAALRSGDVDAVKMVAPGQIDSLRDDTAVNLLQAPVNELGFAGFNLQMDPWRGNDKLRQAVNWAVDRATIAEKVLMGTASPADGIVPGSMPGHQAGAMPYKYNPAKAKALLEEAGYPGGQGLPPIKLSYRTEGPAAEIAQTVQANLAAVGIPVELEGLESGLFMEKMLSGQSSFFMVSWQADYNSPDTFLYPLFKSDQPQNVFAYKSSDVDGLLDKARSSAESRDRIKAYNDAERLILADAPVVPLIFRQDVMAYSPKVTNFVHTSLGDLALNEITVSGK